MFPNEALLIKESTGKSDSEVQTYLKLKHGAKAVDRKEHVNFQGCAVSHNEVQSYSEVW